MLGLRFDWRLGVRLIGALALVLVAFAHRLPMPAAGAVPDIQAYAFPDGSLPIICITGPADEAPQQARHALPCDACLITASALVPQPAGLALPAFGSFQPSPPVPTASRLPRNAWPPAAPPTAPPLA